MANYDKFIPASLTLDDTYAIKILICYFMRQIDRPITHNQLAEIATADGSVNYFVFFRRLGGDDRLGHDYSQDDRFRGVLHFVGECL